MKKLVLLSLVSLMTTLVWANQPGKVGKLKPVAKKSAAQNHDRKNEGQP